MFFVGDNYLFFKACPKDATAISSVLYKYEISSGQSSNLSKSEILFSPNVDEHRRLEICECLSIKEVEDPGSSLGLPTYIGANRRRVFVGIKNKIWQKLSSWNRKKLSHTGKEILLKTFAHTLPNYVMSVVLLLLTICKEIEKMLARFLWSNADTTSITWCSWERMSKPKSFRGLGFKNLHDFNLAMLASQGWQLLIQPNSLVSRVLKARYYQNVSLLNADLGDNPSYT